MEHSKSSDEVREVFRTGYLRKMTLATLLMIVMVGSGFLVSVARAETAPSIWTDKDSYLVGETVMIQGQGFLPGLVSLTVSHPVLGELNYVSAVGADGTFVCEDYVSAAVENASIPLTVVAMQDEMHHAQTQFYDPAGHSKLEGWTLHPGAPHWTDGDVKGYNEGDVVPVQIVFTSGNDPGFLASLGTITGRIAFEYGYGFLPTPEIRGFKEVDRYTWDGLNPSPPYNNPAPSATPFSGVGGIVIVNQVREPLLQDGFRVWDVWDITCYFTSDHAALRAAGQLAMTTGPQKGASFFPGSSLHVKLMNTDPKFPHDGTESLPVIVGIITPPEIELEKFCLPDKLAIGDQVTFEIAAANTGQGDAVLLSLFDCMYGGLLYVDDSTQVWTSADPTKVPFDDPIFVGGDPHRLMWCLDHIVIPGTACAQDPNNRISVWYLSFRAQLVNDECQGDTDNHAILWYTDDHCGEPRYACAECDFEIIHPQLGVDKWSDMTCAAGIYRVVDDQYWPGDVVTYWINVSNPLCSNDIMHFKAYDAILAVELGLPSSDPIMTGCLLPGQYVNESFDYRVTGAEPQPRETNCMFRNTVDVIGWDDFGHKVTPSAYWDIKSTIRT